MLNNKYLLVTHVIMQYFTMVLLKFHFNNYINIKNNNMLVLIVIFISYTQQLLSNIMKII